MNDEESTQEVCRLADVWLFGSRGSQLPSAGEASDVEVLKRSEDRIKVGCFCACRQLLCHTMLPA